MCEMCRYLSEAACMCENVAVSIRSCMQKKKSQDDIEMESFNNLLDIMEEEDIIKSIKGKRRNQQASYNILNEDYMPKNMEQHIYDNGNDNDENSQQIVSEGDKSLEDFIDDKYHETILNKLKVDIINQVMLNVKRTEVTENNDKLITHLENEITFLRTELQSRDSIIELLIKDNKKQCMHLQNSREELKHNDINNTLEVKNTYDLLQDANKQNITSNNTAVIKKRDGKQRKKNRSTCILGDSILKGMETHKIRDALPINERVYVKTFAGADNEDMKSYVVPAKRHDNDLIILHFGTNSLRGNKSEEEIATEIIDLAIEMKTTTNEVMISSIAPRNDNLNPKGINVNKILVSLCKSNNFHFIDNNFNIKKDKHLNTGGLHLNEAGTYLLGCNLVGAIRL